MQVDSHLDRFMVDLRKRVKQRGEASSSSEIDQISESIHLALKAGSATQDTASSKAAAPAPDTAAAPDVAVRSVAVSAPLAVPQPLMSRKEAVAMELCKPTGAPGTAFETLHMASTCLCGGRLRCSQAQSQSIRPQHHKKSLIPHTNHRVLMAVTLVALALRLGSNYSCGVVIRAHEQVLGTVAVRYRAELLR